MKQRDRELGLDRAITRRDFVNGRSRLDGLSPLSLGGYDYGYDPADERVAFLPEERPEAERSWQIGPPRFGRIAIANSDAASNPMTEAAIGQGHRAAQEVLALD